jgi:hypothetical protein
VPPELAGGTAANDNAAPPSQPAAAEVRLAAGAEGTPVGGGPELRVIEGGGGGAVPEAPRAMAGGEQGGGGGPRVVEPAGGRTGGGSPEPAGGGGARASGGPEPLGGAGEGAPPLELNTGPVTPAEPTPLNEIPLEPAQGPAPELETSTSRPTGEQPARATPDIEIRGSDQRVRDMRVLEGKNTGQAELGDVGQHQQQGTRGPNLESEHVTPANELRDASRDPRYGNEPDIQGRIGGSDTADVANQTTVVENERVSDRKTALDEQARQARGGAALDPIEARDAALRRHQQAVDDAVAAGEITPEQATDPVVRALAADAQMWGAGERGGGMAKARADAAAAGQPEVPGARLRNPEKVQDARAGRRGARLGEEPAASRTSGTSTGRGPSTRHPIPTPQFARPRSTPT